MYKVIQLKKAIYEYSNRFVSKWLVLFIDMLLVLLCYLLAYTVVFDFKLNRIPSEDFKFEIPIVLATYLIGFIFSKSFHGVIRHTSLADAWKLFLAVLFALVSFLVFDYMLYDKHLWLIHPAYMPRSVLVTHALLCVLVLFSARVAFKVGYYKLVVGTRSKHNVIIYGAGNAGITTVNTLTSNKANNSLNIVGFFDDNPTKINKTILGYKVYSPDKDLENVVKNLKVNEVIFAIHNIPKPRKRMIVDKLLELKVQVKIIPPFEQWINGEFDTKQIKSINIEDVLGRESIKLDLQNISNQIDGKNILVTGAAGSIGSEMCRQLANFKPAKIILLDQSETGVFEIENELKEKLKKSSIELVAIIADVSVKQRLQDVFVKHKINIVYHAAAYKHVPMMENNPNEAILCNVRGTKNVADLALDFNCEKFVMVSTDKAVNPTNVMGASKRIAEIYVQTLQQRILSEANQKVKFITTRFGNVLGSNGSVLPIFKKQIAAGGPVKVTHPDITRYFMTIPEACQLVMEAGAMGKGGEIFIFDMGESVKIYDLAKKMIRLSGFTPEIDIKIEFTGLREGEKLYEELLNDKEKTIPTHHEKIMIANVRKDNYEQISLQIDTLIALAKENDSMKIVKQMKKIVPEFLSQNSVYEVLDVQ
jgi:FlaA1/EpsC-like NDP-sugar epimerase